MLTRVARSFSKLKVPEGYSGNSKLYKTKFQTFSQGDKLPKLEINSCLQKLVGWCGVESTEMACLLKRLRHL